MNRRLSLASLVIASLPLLLPLSSASAEGVFARSARQRLERFCATPLAKRRPVACRGIAHSSSSSSSSGVVIRPPVTSSSSSRSSSSSSIQTGFDPKLAEPVQSHIMLLGTTTPTLAVVRFTSLTEPLTADAVTIQITGDVASLEALRIYNIDGRLLATASRDVTDPARYRVAIPLGSFLIDKGHDASMYVRGVLSGKDTGGVSGETIMIDHVVLDATGDWSTNHYSVTSTETLPASMTARARITSLVANTSGNWPLTTGTDQLLWDFSVSGQTADGTAELRLTNLDFTLSQANVNLTNVRLKAADGSSETLCSVLSNHITCDSLPAGVGSVPKNGTIRMRLYGDIAVIGSPILAYVQVSLGEAGSVFGPGVIDWTDGSSSFDWVDLESPLGVGPRFNQ